MKKQGKRIISLLSAVMLIASMLAGCGANGKSIMTDTYSEYENLASNCTVINSEGKQISGFKLKG